MVNIDGICFIPVVINFEDHLHVVGGAVATESSVDVLSVRSGYVVIVLAGFELEASRDGTEGSKCDGEVLEVLRSVTNGHNLGSRVGYPAGIKLLLGDTVDHMFLLGVEWTDDVHLVVLPRKISSVDIHDMVGVVFSKNRVGCVPEHQMASHATAASRQQH